MAERAGAAPAGTGEPAGEPAGAQAAAPVGTGEPAAAPAGTGEPAAAPAGTGEPAGGPAGAARGGDRPERILLVGMMGAGKTTVGRALADRLGWRFLDSDDQVVAATGRTVREIFESGGEHAFRKLESQALEMAVAAGPRTVIAVAGGAVLRDANRALLRRSGTVVWLRAPAGTLARRVTAGDHRPLLDDDPPRALAALAQAREPLYRELADLTVDAGDATPGELVERILAEVGR